MRAAVVALVTLFPFAAAAQDASSGSLCTEYDRGTEVAKLADDRIDEASGIAASWRNEGVYWVHNDSGDSARVFAIDITGQTKTVLTLAAEAEDWEDIAVGPCAPGDDTPCVWVGDIGDNDEERPNITLYRFEEPVLGATPPQTLQVDDVTAISVTYEGGARNAETLLVHPVTGRVYIVDKTVGDPTNLWSVPTDGVTPASIIASTALGEVGIVSGRVTGGDFAPGGDELTIRTYHYLYTMCGATPEAAFEGPRSQVIGTTLFQSEAVTYTRDGASVLTTTEVQSTEQPPLLQMRPVQSPPMPMPDAGDEPVTPARDVGARPAPNGGADVQITLLDDYKKSSCSCGTATGQLDAGFLLLLGVAAVGRSRRRVCRSAGGVN